MDRYRPPTFDEIIAEAIAYTLRHGDHPPMIYVVGDYATGKVILEEMPPTADMRAILMYAIGLEVSQADLGRLIRVDFVFESWMSTMQPGQTSLEVLPSEDPHRIEILLCSNYELADRRLDLVALRILRDRAGNVVDLITQMDSRKEAPDIAPESHLVDAFMLGYRKGKRNAPRGRG